MSKLQSYLCSTTLVENLIDLGINPVVSNYFPESVLPLANPLAADIEVIRDGLAALAIGQSIKKAPEVQAPIALDEIPSDPLAALG
ncbi:MAG: hypothetical protein P8R54_08380 [Myxococcota bacterium]|nr:hypothetical protein [Myxococcota bacterium]